MDKKKRSYYSEIAFWLLLSNSLNIQFKKAHSVNNASALNSRLLNVILKNLKV